MNTTSLTVYFFLHHSNSFTPVRIPGFLFPLAEHVHPIHITIGLILTTLFAANIPAVRKLCTRCIAINKTTFYQKTHNHKIKATVKLSVVGYIEGCTKFTVHCTQQYQTWYTCPLDKAISISAYKTVKKISLCSKLFTYTLYIYIFDLYMLIFTDKE